MAARRGTKRPFYSTRPNNFQIQKSVSDREPENDTKREPVLDSRFSRDTKEFIAFDSRFVRSLLGNLKVLMIGDSLMRGLYKDIVTWLTTDDLTRDSEIKARAEPSHRGDRQIDCTLLTDDKIFRQAREYQTEHFLVQFLFTTRVMKDDMEMLIKQMLGDDGYPDVILINSMIWDLTRYFKVAMDTAYSDTFYQKKIEIEAIQKYLDRTAMFLRRLRAVLPPHTTVVWVCFPHCRPSQSNRGIQATPLASERNHFIRSVMIDGSFRVAQVVRNAGFDILDIGFYMRNHAFYHYQKNDGMHWLPAGVRLMSALVMQFLAKSWGIDTSSYLSNLDKKQAREAVNTATEQFRIHNYYSKEIPKIQDEIAETTFNKLRADDREELEEIIKKARAIVPLLMPPIKKKTRKNVYTGFHKSERFVDEVRLAPRLDKSARDEVDELGMELLSVAGSHEANLPSGGNKFTPFIPPESNFPSGGNKFTPFIPPESSLPTGGNKFTPLNPYESNRPSGGYKFSPFYR